VAVLGSRMIGTIALLAGIDRRRARSEYAPLPDCARRLLNAGALPGSRYSLLRRLPTLFNEQTRGLGCPKYTGEVQAVKPLSIELRASVSWRIF